MAKWVVVSSNVGARWAFHLTLVYLGCGLYRSGAYFQVQVFPVRGFGSPAVAITATRRMSRFFFGGGQEMVPCRTCMSWSGPRRLRVWPRVVRKTLLLNLVVWEDQPHVCLSWLYVNENGFIPMPYQIA